MTVGRSLFFAPAFIDRRYNPDVVKGNPYLVAAATCLRSATALN
jgi:hypothetical protein